MELMKDRCTLKIIFVNTMSVQQTVAHSPQSMANIVNNSIKQRRPAQVMMCNPDGTEPAAAFIDFNQLLVMSIVPLAEAEKPKATIDAAGRVIEEEEKKSNLIL